LRMCKSVPQIVVNSIFTIASPASEFPVSADLRSPSIRGRDKQAPSSATPYSLRRAGPHGISPAIIQCMKRRFSSPANRVCRGRQACWISP
jgi:hypothetical protein